MIFSIQGVLFSVLILILAALYVEERRKKISRAPTGKLIHVWDGSERRRFVRMPVSIPIKYSFPKKIENIKAAKIKDISIGGACLVINEKLNIKTNICLEIKTADNSAPILARGEVVWIKESVETQDSEGIRHFSIGIEFKDILSKDRERLSKFIMDAGQA
jgi:c-di-GMP-binding flagellar brake protein YcgR